MSRRNNKKQQQICQKRAAKVRERAKRSKGNREVGHAALKTNHTPMPDPTALPLWVHEAPYGMVVSPEDPDEMHVRRIGNIVIHRPRTAAEISIRTAAEVHLRSEYDPGTYTDPKQINEILHYHFQFFDEELRKSMPRIGSRHFMEFVLHQYDLSCKIDGLWKKGQLDPEDAGYWQGIEAEWRRALKYLAECTAMLAPDEAPVAPKGEILDLMDRAMISAEELVRIALLSDQTYMLFPNDSQLLSFAKVM